MNLLRPENLESKRHACVIILVTVAMHMHTGGLWSSSAFLTTHRTKKALEPIHTHKSCDTKDQRQQEPIFCFLYRNI